LMTRIATGHPRHQGVVSPDEEPGLHRRLV
jgi:hypothetical protein